MKKWIIGIIAFNCVIGAILVYFLLQNIEAQPVATPDQTQIAEASSPITKKVKVSYGTPYVILLEDAGVNGELIGCNDSVVPLPTLTEVGPSQEQAITKALNALLAMTTESLVEAVQVEMEYDTDFYTILNQPQLTLSNVQVSSNVAHVYFKGSVSLGGVCDMPRFEAQLRNTVESVQGITGSVFYLNNSESEFNALLSQQ